MTALGSERSDLTQANVKPKNGNDGYGKTAVRYLHVPYFKEALKV